MSEAGLTAEDAFDTGHWREVARVDLEQADTLAVFQTDPDGAIRYLIFWQRPTGYWQCLEQSGHYGSLEEAVSDAASWET